MTNQRTARSARLAVVADAVLHAELAALAVLWRALANAPVQPLPRVIVAGHVPALEALNRCAVHHLGAFHNLAEHDEP
jgi:hypothetical protein